MFELVRALSLDPAAGIARGRASIDREPWLADHFPGAPLVPATVLLELAAQIAGPLAEDVPRTMCHAQCATHNVPRTLGAVLGMVRSAVFRTAVSVPAEIEIEARLVRAEESSVVCRVEIEGTMSAELVFAMIEVDVEGEAWRAREARVARWREAWR